MEQKNRINYERTVIEMIFVILCAGSALLGFIMGFLFADRIADQKIAEMRLEAGLDINTGQVIGSDDDELFK
ncbi:MAG: hypothetical protein J6U00_08920 [Ruminococcus sp.]|uniref:hypothetical protein n=1 Tax=Ruminococcus sp. TaxID=41978 RepID=UPI001B25C6A7|nr:hypothetical protein [Ruminococcus sp.]MBO7474103.1 hypothetical protein [Ruminococcus sp.]